MTLQKIQTRKHPKGKVSTQEIVEEVCQTLALTSGDMTEWAKADCPELLVGVKMPNVAKEMLSFAFEKLEVRDMKKEKLTQAEFETLILSHAVTIGVWFNSCMYMIRKFCGTMEADSLIESVQNAVENALKTVKPEEWKKT